MTQADVLIIGGSFAGLSAAMPLLRARRRVTIIDAGERRNRFAAQAHGVIALDGLPPGEIAARARADVSAYPTLSWVEGRAEAIEAGPAGFTATLADGTTQSGARLILATGVTDELPDIPGLAPLWGARVFHCPYCHGYELGGRPVAVLATGPASLHQAQLIRDWGPVTLIANGALPLDADTRAALAARDITIEETPLAQVAPSGATDIMLRLADGRALTFAGLFTAPPQRPSSDFAARLGCEMIAGPTGPLVRTDAMQATSHRHVFACGDAAGPQSLPFAIGTGTMAGTAAHRSLLFP
ncbi:NAD(P)/FAD-dependent oxidoreductase [Pseudoroseicyclus sp. CXY001]|uniref:NAD(P)/FAD-dependent oxidoreductase n=1 Tax=Pseudoroseicyclus sp. CXY001 TaxID=3242492 RepID=UPI003570BEBC